MRRDSGALLASAPLFAALGDEQRLRIVARLSREGPLSLRRAREQLDVIAQQWDASIERLRAMVEDE